MIDGTTGDQRFYLGWAQVWRRNYREANLRQRLLTDPHSPSEQRAAVVRNLDPWYSAFNVQPGQKLYLAPAAAGAHLVEPCSTSSSPRLTPNRSTAACAGWCRRWSPRPRPAGRCCSACSASRCSPACSSPAAWRCWSRPSSSIGAPQPRCAGRAAGRCPIYALVGSALDLLARSRSALTDGDGTAGHRSIAPYRERFGDARARSTGDRRRGRGASARRRCATAAWRDGAGATADVADSPAGRSTCRGRARRRAAATCCCGVSRVPRSPIC